MRCIIAMGVAEQREKEQENCNEECHGCFDMHKLFNLNAGLLCTNS